MTAVTSARPLAGRLVVVTRPRAQARVFATLLEEAGATVLLVPTIVIEPPASWESLDRALDRIDDYRWAVFTSVNGVEMTRRRLEDLGRGAAVLRGRRLAAIGPATAGALRDVGLEPEVVPEEYVAEGASSKPRALSSTRCPPTGRARPLRMRASFAVRSPRDAWTSSPSRARPRCGTSPLSFHPGTSRASCRGWPSPALAR